MYVSYKNVREMVWMAAVKLLRIYESKINLKQSEIIQLTQDIQKLKHTHTSSSNPTHTHTHTCTT